MDCRAGCVALVSQHRVLSGIRVSLSGLKFRPEEFESLGKQARNGEY